MVILVDQQNYNHKLSTTRVLIENAFLDYSNKDLSN